MSNLFSCLWFNEVDRFPPRDQLCFAYTYQKMRRMNPGKQFHLNMFKVSNSMECHHLKVNGIRVSEIIKVKLVVWDGITFSVQYI